MRKISEENLKSALSGESQAHIKYMIYAEKAEEEGLKNVSRLFKAVAYSEFIHAKNHSKILGIIKSTRENLENAINGEKFEVEEMYPAYNLVAKSQNENGVALATNWALESEKIHLSLYEKAKSKVNFGEDIELEAIHVCIICGYTVEGEKPEKCPICGASRDKFKTF